MFITSIELQNFGPYLNESLQIEQPSDGRHIVLVHGENRHGKTSIFKALQWALYGETNKQKRFDLINEQSAEVGGKTKVTVNFTREKRDFSLTRSLSYGKNVNDRSHVSEEFSLLVDGIPHQERSIQTLDEFIGTILPKSASQFYFFDGASIEHYANDSTGDDVKDAIKTFLGLDVCDKTVADLDSIIKDLRKQISAENAKDIKHQNATQKHAEIQDKHSKLQEELQTSKKLLDEEKRLKDEIAVELKQYKEVESLNTQIEQCELTLKTVQEELKELNQSEKELVSKNYLMVFSNQLKQAKTQVELEKETIDEEWDRLSRNKGKAELIEQLLEHDDSCICGNALTSDRQQNLLNMKGTLSFTEAEYEKVGKRRFRVKELLEKLNETLQEAKQTEHNFNNLNTDITKKMNQERKLKEDLKRLHKSLRSAGFSDVEDLANRYQQHQDQIEVLSVRLGQQKADLSKLSAELDAFDLEAIRYSGSNAALIELNKQLKVSLSLKATFNQYMEDIISFKKAGIQETANTIYQRVINASFGSLSIEFNDNYSFSLKTPSIGITPLRRESPGGKQVAAFSFIMGLNTYASLAAPILFDTPTGHLDDTHKLRISEELTKYNRGQVFLFVTTADLKSGVGERLKNHISQEFDLTRDEMERYSKIEERVKVI